MGAAEGADDGGAGLGAAAASGSPATPPPLPLADPSSSAADPKPGRKLSPSISLSGGSPEPPPEFIDPISDEIMVDPVMLLETGQTYERASIQRWFQTCQPDNCRDPLTGTVLKSTEVRSCCGCAVRAAGVCGGGSVCS
jgi:hypothetical protein